MALKTTVKVSKINNLSDARYCAGMSVQLMGFNLEDHDRNYVSPEKFREITSWLSGPEYVGEFENTHPDMLLSTLRDYEVSYIQIRELAHLQMLLNTGYRIILKQNIRDEEDIRYLTSIAPGLKDNGVTLLLESEALDLNPEVLQIIRALAESTAVLLGFGITADKVDEILEQTRIKGIALHGGGEIKTGVGDFDRLAEILESVEMED